MDEREGVACGDPEKMLRFLRGSGQFSELKPGPHYRGCHVLDFLLTKE